MRKISFFNVVLFAAAMLFAGASLTSCGDDKDDNKVNPEDVSGSGDTSSTVTPEDLYGTWTICGPGSNSNSVAEFTKDNIIIKQNGQEVAKEPYTLENGVISYGKYKSAPGLLYDKSTLAFKALVTTDEGDKEELGMLLFKEGKKVTATVDDIQGTWCYWYNFGGEDIIRVGITFEGNNFKLYITPWGQRYDGTFTYVDGYVKMTVTAGFTAREEGTGDGELWGRMNPKTLECNDWRTLAPRYWHTEGFTEGPFIANGDEAYGIIPWPVVYKKMK